MCGAAPSGLLRRAGHLPQRRPGRHRRHAIPICALSTFGGDHDAVVGTVRIHESRSAQANGGARALPLPGLPGYRDPGRRADPGRGLFGPCAGLHALPRPCAEPQRRLCSRACTGRASTRWSSTAARITSCRPISPPIRPCTIPSKRLIGIGVYPFVVPFVPISGTPLESHPAPSARLHAPHPRSRSPACSPGPACAPTDIKAGCGQLRRLLGPLHLRAPGGSRMILEPVAPYRPSHFRVKFATRSPGSSAAARRCGVRSSARSRASSPATTGTPSMRTPSRSAPCPPSGRHRRRRRHRPHPRGGGTTRRMVGLAPRRRRALSAAPRTRHRPDPGRGRLAPMRAAARCFSPMCRAATSPCSDACTGRASTRSSCTAARITSCGRTSPPIRRCTIPNTG